MSVGHDLAYWLGLTNPAGPPYLAWSGVVGNLTYLAVLGVLVRRGRCSVSSCWRPGLYRVAGTEYTVCRHHHPTGKVTTHQMVIDAWAAAHGGLESPVVASPADGVPGGADDPQDGADDDQDKPDGPEHRDGE
jgi:hypothetical protein